METAALSSIHWHEERFAYDCQARNHEVEQACFHHFYGKNKMTIVDLGSGTGSNCLYFFEKFPAQQNWIFIEQKAHVSEYALKRLKREAEASGYEATTDANKLTLKKEERSVEIEYLTDSFLDLEKLVNLDEVDLVMASAVFDLLSFPQFTSFASVLLEKKLPLLTTLNYADMNFDDDIPADIFFIEKYESYMNRPQEFGKAMGKKCPRVLVDFFQKQQAEVVYGSSIWKLEGKPAKIMNHHLLNFMEASINHVLEDEEEKKSFDEWVDKKRVMTDEGELNTYVQYYDLFVSNA